MIDKLEAIKKRWTELGTLLTDAAVVTDQSRQRKLGKEYKELSDIVELYDKYRQVLSNIANNKHILETERDEEFREMAKTELDELLPKRDQLEDELKDLLIPKDPEDDRNAIIEIRAGTGGDEASIFAGNLFDMYKRYCENQEWTMRLISSSPGTAGGFKEIIAEVEGEGAYGKLKFESGVHRVQRVPKTETQGRTHTSAATVAVLPEAEEVDVQIRTEDIRRDTYRASGAGGQHVNKTESAVRLTHIPTGVVAECQQERSQMRNYEVAMTMLRTKIYEQEVQKRQSEISRQRKTMVSTGDRSAKIRTYNFPQSRVTDHRIGLTLHDIQNIMLGDIDELIESLRIAENAEKLKAGG